MQRVFEIPLEANSSSYNQQIPRSNRNILSERESTYANISIASEYNLIHFCFGLQTSHFHFYIHMSPSSIYNT